MVRAFQLGSLAALQKLGMRDIPPLTERVRRDNEPVAPDGNAFDHFDKMVMNNARVGKTAASMSPVPSVAGFRNSSRMSFPSGATQMLKAPKPQMSKNNMGGSLNPLGPMKQQNFLDPRAQKPAGMNLQHQISENAATMDSANSMTSPQRRHITPL